MTRAEIETILGAVLPLSQTPTPAPSTADWERLKKKFQRDFDADFITFYELVGNYDFYGGLLSIASPEDTIESSYDHESGIWYWPAALVPFYCVGNGDYLCLGSPENGESPLYYIDHEDGQVTMEYPSFSAWIRGLPDWFAE